MLNKDKGVVKMNNYSYPIDVAWTTNETIAVVEFLQKIESAYEKGIAVEDLQSAYKEFKKVVKSIGEEKRLGADFEKESGYSIYRTIQEMKSTTRKIVKM